MLETEGRRQAFVARGELLNLDARNIKFLPHGIVLQEGAEILIRFELNRATKSGIPSRVARGDLLRFHLRFRADDILVRGRWRILGEGRAAISPEPGTLIWTTSARTEEFAGGYPKAANDIAILRD